MKPERSCTAASSLGGALLLVALVLAVALSACGETRDTGGLMLVIRSDMNVGVDFDTMRVEVSSGDTVLHDATCSVGPKGYLLPSTLALVAGESATVALRVTARQAGKLRVLWQARTTVPRGRLAALSADLLWSCEGRAIDTAAGVVSTCDSGLTCIDGRSVCLARRRLEHAPRVRPHDGPAGERSRMCERASRL